MTIDHLGPRFAPTPLGLRSRPSLRARALHRDSVLRRLDYTLLLSVLALCAIGALLIWSATRQKQLDRHLDPRAFLKKDVLNVGIGLALAAGAALVDYRSLRFYAPVVYVLSVLGLLAVLAPHIGATINGAHSWILLPAGFQVQPAEFAKVALVVGGAFLLAERRDGDDRPRSPDVLLVLGLAAVPMGLIMLQPDFGTMMVFVFTILGLLAVSGVARRWVVGLALAGVAAGWLIIAGGFLQGYQRERLLNFTQPGTNTGTSGYQVNQAVTAIGSGGIFGKGLFNGTQTKGAYIPEQQTDFVFTVAGEELGLVGAGLLLLLLGLVLWRACAIAAAAVDPFGAIVAGGVVSWFAFQSFVNIGMTLGIMPLTGLPLPFVSYGGSAMFTNLVAIGLLQNVHMRSRSRDA